MRRLSALCASLVLFTIGSGLHAQIDSFMAANHVVSSGVDGPIHCAPLIWRTMRWSLRIGGVRGPGGYCAPAGGSVPIVLETATNGVNGILLEQRINWNAVLEEYPPEGSIAFVTRMNDIEDKVRSWVIEKDDSFLFSMTRVTTDPTWSGWSDSFLSVGEACFSVRIDGQGPDIAFLGASLGGYSSLPVAFLVRDEESGPRSATLVVDGKAVALEAMACVDQREMRYSGTASSLSEGHHTWHFSAFDAVGNASDSTGTLTVDLSPPRFSPSLEPAGWTMGTVIARPNASDDLSSLRSLEVSVNGSPFAPLGFVGGRPGFRVAAGEGSLVLSFRATDAAGNAAEARIEVANRDTTAPRIHLPAGGWTREGSLRAEAEDALSGVEESSWRWREESGEWRWEREALLAEGPARTIEFAVSDRAGNAAAAAGSWAVDRTGPVFRATVPTLAGPRGMSLRDLVFSDALSGPATIDWSLDGGSWTAWADPGSGLIALPPSLAKGLHSFRVRAWDRAGNQSSLPAVAFWFDPVPPDAPLLNLSVGGRLVEDGAWLAERSGRIEVANAAILPATLPLPGGSRKEGMSYVWRTTASAEWRVSALPSWEIALAEGENRLEVFVRDEAGNEGPISAFLARVDSSLPSPPSIIGLSHPRAERDVDAVRFTEASFSVLPGPSGPSGVSELGWRLSCGGAELRAGSMPARGGRLRFEDLASNGPGEFYDLDVRARSNSGLEGEPSSWRFRIDDRPPEFLRLSLLPQADGTSWYSQAVVRLCWEGARDGTGIRSCRWRASRMDGTGGPPAYPAPDADLSSWREGDASAEAWFDATSLVGETGVGRLGFVLCADDWAGNRSWARAVCFLDLRPPQFTDSSGQDLVLVESEDGLILSWPAAYDEGSGLLGYALSLRRMGREDAEERFVAADPSVGGNSRLMALMGGCGDPALWFASVRAIDRAGNECRRSGLVATGGMEIPELAEGPFHEWVEDWELGGRTLSTASGEVLSCISAWLRPPTEMGASLPGGTEVSGDARLPLVPEAMAFGEDGRPRAAALESSALALDGVWPRLSGASPSWNEEEGLVLSPALFGLACADGERTVRAARAWSGIHRGEGPFTAVGVLEDSASMDLSGSGGLLRVEGVEGASAMGSRRIRLFGKWLSFRMPIDNPLRGASGNAVGVEWLDIAQGNSLRGGALAPGAIIRLDGMDFSIRSSRLESSRLTIDDAVHEGERGSLLRLHGLALELPGGALSLLPGFSIEGLSSEWGGGMYLAGLSWTLSADGLSASGRLAAAGTPWDALAFEGLRLAKGEWDRASGLRIVSPPELHPAGFRLLVEHARLTERGCLVERGRLFLGERGFLVADLGLGADGRGVWSPGRLLEQGELETGWGSPCVLRGLSLREDSAMADIDLPVDPGMFPYRAAGFLSLQGVRLLPGLRFSGSTLLMAEPLSLGECRFTADLGFEDGRLKADALVIEAFDGLLRPLPAFVGLELSSAGVARPAHAEGGAEWRSGGWRLVWDELLLDGQGVHGPARLDLPPALGGMSRELADSCLGPMGPSGPLVNDQGWLSIIMDGWLARLEGPRFQSRDGTMCLGCAALRLDLSALGAGELDMGGAWIAADGSHEALGARLAGTLEGLGGWRITGGDLSFSSGALSASGALSYPGWEGSAPRMLQRSLELMPDGTMTDDAQPVAGAFSLGGCFARAASLIPGAEGPILRSCALKLGQAWLELGDLRVDGRGRPRERRRLDSGLSFPAAWGALEVDGAELGPEGLSLDGWLSLPAALGGGSARLEGFRLDESGRLLGTASVESLEMAMGGIGLSLEGLSAGPDGLRAASASLRLPGSEAGIALRDVKIDRAGPSFAGASIAPFELWGMGFRLESLSWGTDGLSFSGAASLPAAMPAGLGGRVVRIERLSLGPDGKPREFILGVDGAFPLALPCGWTASLSGLRTEWSEGMRLPRLVADRASIALPPGLGQTELVMRGAALDMNDGRPDFGGIELEGELAVERGGFRASLTGLSLDAEGNMSFTGSVRATDVASLPPFLRGARLDVLECRLEAGRGLASLRVRASGLSGPLCDWLVLDDATAEFGLGEGQSLLSLAGGLLFGASAPSGLAGRGLKLLSCSYDLSARRLLSLQAEGGPFAFDCDAGRVEEAMARLSLDEGGRVDLRLSGALVLPASLPGILSGARACLNELSYEEGAGLIRLDASISAAGSSPLFGIASVRDLAARVSLDEGSARYSVKGTLVLGGPGLSPSIAGLAGCELSLVRLVLDGAGRVVDAEASLSLPSRALSPSVFLDGARLWFLASEGGPGRIEASGRLRLGDSFPAGLGGTVLELSKLSVPLEGGPPSMEAAAAIPRFTAVPGRVAVTNARLEVSANADELLFRGSGRLEIVASGLPGNLSGAAFDLREILVSDKRGLLALDAGLAGGIEIPLGAAAVARLSSLSIGETGFGGSGSISLNERAPSGLVGFAARVDAFSMGWDGKLSALSGAAEGARLDLGGFLVETGPVSLDASGMGFSSCRLLLPPNMGSLGGAGIGLGGVRWDFSRSRLEAGIEGGRIEASFAGFVLCLEGARIDQESKRIAFDRARFVPPSFIGGTGLILQGVSLDPGGLRLAGGSFALPDFAIAGGLGFRGLRAQFACLERPVDGAWFTLSAAGSVLLPGVGCLAAELSFANRCDLYPIGLKRAFFEFSASGRGLPLGSTGLFLNTVRGGLAYGPPEEVPDSMEGAFGPEGPRLQLGLRLVDASAGAVFSADANAWIDLKAAAFAFAGDTALFKGALNIKAGFVAAWGRYGFYAGMAVELALVRGSLELRIFEADGASRVAGRGCVSIGLERGSILNWSWLKVPNDKLWLGGLKAEFGSFMENGQDLTGFKAFVELPLLGQAGVFTDGRGLRIGDLSSVRLRECPVKAAGVGALAASKAAGGAGSLGRRDVAFTIGAAGPEKAFLLGIGRDPEMGPLGELAATLMSPSGAVIDALGLPGERSSNGFIVRVDGPESGEWRLELVAGKPEDLEIAVLAQTAPPSLSVSAISGGSSPGSGRLLVTGSVKGVPEDGSRLLLGLVPEDAWRAPDGEAPRIELEPGVVAAEGAFSLELDRSLLAEGRYALFVRLDRGGLLPSVEAQAPGVVEVSHEGEALPPVKGLRAAVDGDAALLSWEGSRRAVVAGYRLFWTGGGQEGEAWLGDLRSLRLPGFAGAGMMEFRLRAESLDGRAGPLSEALSLRFDGVDLPDEGPSEHPGGGNPDGAQGGGQTPPSGMPRLFSSSAIQYDFPSSRAWSQEAGGGGAARSWAGPVSDVVQGIGRCVEGRVLGVVEGGGLFWFRTADSLWSYDPASGRSADRGIGPLAWMGWAGGGLWTRDEAGAIRRLGAEGGVDMALEGRWDDASSDGSLLCLRRRDSWFLLDAGSGKAVSAPVPALSGDRLLAWWKGRPLLARGNALVALGPGGAETIRETRVPCAALALDERGAVSLGADGSLILYDALWSPYASVAADDGLGSVSLALAGDIVVAAGSERSQALSRQDAALRWAAPGARLVAVSAERAYLSGQSGLWSVDGQSGASSLIHEEPCSAVALPSGRLVLATGEGELFLAPP